MGLSSRRASWTTALIESDQQGESGNPASERIRWRGRSARDESVGLDRDGIVMRIERCI